MADTVLEFEVTVDAGLWGPFVALCEARGDNPLATLTEMCNIGMQLSLEEMVGIDNGVSVEEAEAATCYEDAVAAVSQWLSAKRRISLRQAEQEAVEYLETL